MNLERVVLGLFACLCLAGVARAEPTARLHGSVMHDGQPVAGATVMVNRAWPIKGIAYYCPGCYLDCGKSATTDDKGAWEIGRLDSTLKFELLVVAKGHVPTVTKPLEPSGGAVGVSLSARALSSIPSERKVTGRVVDSEGKAVRGAVVSPEMVYTDGGGCGGLCDGLDQLDVTDEDGTFTLTYKDACRAMDLSVSARGCAHACFPGRVSGGKVHELRVGEGVSVMGRLRRDGKAVRDVEMTLVAKQSGAAGVCYDRQVIATGTEGEFLFVNVLPGQRYVLTASTQQLGRGCVVPLPVDLTSDRGPEVDVGGVEVVPGVRVSGRVVMAEGGTLPEMKLTLSSDAGWDGVTLDVGPSGSFDFPEVAPGVYSLYVAARGAFVSLRNRSVDSVNLGGLVGRVEKDIRGLEVEVTRTKPERRRPDDEANPPELGGTERPDAAAVRAAPVAPKPGVLRGVVTWEGRPLPRTLVTVAGPTLSERGVWVEHHSDDKQWAFTDEAGTFEFPIMQATSAWLTFAGPEGQYAAATGVVGEQATTFELRRAEAFRDGKTCALRVVDAAGRPIAGATVVPTQYVAEVGGGWSGELACGARRTDKEGRVTVGLAMGQKGVAQNVVGLGVRVLAEGYAPRDVSNLVFGEAARDVVLDAGASVRGILQGPSGPLEGALVLCMPAASGGDRTALRRGVRTDARGGFVFEHLPPSGDQWIAAPAWGNSAGLVGGPVSVRTPAPGGVVDAGVLVGTPGRTVGGRLAPAEGTKLSAGAWVAMWHEGAWLGWAAPVGPRGEFVFTGVPDGGAYVLSVNSGGGEMVALENVSASRSYPMALRGTVTRDHPNLEVRMLKAGARREAIIPRDLPLRGVEGLTAR